jgi:hypothetical protein
MAIQIVFETHAINSVPLETLAAAGFAWQPGWEYRLG